MSEQINYWQIIAQSAAEMQQMAHQLSNSEELSMDTIEDLNDINGMIAELIWMGTTKMDRSIASHHIMVALAPESGKGYVKRLKKVILG